MSETRRMWSFAHQQSADSAPYYTSNPYKPRQNPRRHFYPAGPLPTVAEIADPEHLIATYYAIKARGGWAAGPDGTSYPDLGASEVANLMRELSQIVLDGSYCHGPTRAQVIAKLRGGTRTLQIANLCDRVLSAAIHAMMTPFWETVFLSWSMGCRPFPRGLWRLLAELKHTVITQNRWVIAIDDVRKAFDNVSIADAMNDHREYITDTSLLALIETVLQGSDGPRRRRGIDQGAAYSPAVMNLRLHRTLDVEVGSRMVRPARATFTPGCIQSPRGRRSSFRSASVRSHRSRNRSNCSSRNLQPVVAIPPQFATELR